MEFLKSQRRFDFMYGKTAFQDLDCAVTQTQEGNVLTSTYLLADGLQITNIATHHGDAYEWVTWWENTSSQPSDIISGLWDCSVSLDLPHEDPVAWSAYQPDWDDITTVYAPSGSNLSEYEFYSYASYKADNRYEGHLYPGTPKSYANTNGRSSESVAPFFNVHKSGQGYIFAIGWSGQWNCTLARTEDALIIKTKIEDTHFRLLPGERFRTSSFVLMPYKGSVIQSQNQWRRLVKRSFSLIGQPGRDSQGPLCAGIWGGMKTESVLKRISCIQEYQLPVEYIWMDAGWYGQDTQPTPDEFEGDWDVHTGDWRVSPLIHPGHLKDVSRAIHDSGRKFLLWFEPERVIRHTPIASEHPEYFIFPEDESKLSLLLDLGNPDAWNYCFQTLSGLIEELSLDCYRQDFNFHPLPYWRQNDKPDRQGISEIKHINGLYRLWDALLERFPHLLIDNCASGGRRIDIETLRRSIPLWRSDYQCPANYPVEGAQCHHLTFHLWMPYSGTGSGRGYDSYRLRSAYSPALTTNYTFSERDSFGDDADKLIWLKKQLEEYLQIRPYLTEDFYPLTEVSHQKDIWSAAQFDRPDSDDGIIQIFRREYAPYETAVFRLNGIDSSCEYLITDADDHSEYTISGAKLTEEGFRITLSFVRSAKIYFYRKV